MNLKKEPAENTEQIEYREAQKNLKDAELKIILRNHGIDPYALSQKDIDEIRRLINKIQQVKVSTESKMRVIQNEGQKEIEELSKEAEIIITRVGQEQHPTVSAPPYPAAEQAGQQAEVVEPIKEPVDTGAQRQ